MDSKTEADGNAALARVLIDHARAHEHQQEGHDPHPPGPTGEEGAVMGRLMDPQDLPAPTGSPTTPTLAIGTPAFGSVGHHGGGGSCSTSRQNRKLYGNMPHEPLQLSSERLDCLESNPNEGRPEYLQDTCSICLEKYTDGDPSMGYACGHAFHLQCAECWRQRNEACPLCWQLLVEKGLYYSDEDSQEEDSQDTRLSERKSLLTGKPPGEKRKGKKGRPQGLQMPKIPRRTPRRSPSEQSFQGSSGSSRSALEGEYMDGLGRHGGVNMERSMSSLGTPTNTNGNHTATATLSATATGQHLGGRGEGGAPGTLSALGTNSSDSSSLGLPEEIWSQEGEGVVGQPEPIVQTQTRCGGGRPCGCFSWLRRGHQATPVPSSSDPGSEDL